MRSDTWHINHEQWRCNPNIKKNCVPVLCKVGSFTVTTCQVSGPRMNSIMWHSLRWGTSLLGGTYNTWSEGMRNVLNYLFMTAWRVMLGPEWCACQWEANRLLAEWSGFKCLMVVAAAQGDLAVKVRPWEVAAVPAKGSKLLILWEADFGCDSLPLREGGDSPSFLSSLLRVSSRGSFGTVVLDIHSQLKMYTKSTVS